MRGIITKTSVLLIAFVLLLMQGACSPINRPATVVDPIEVAIPYATQSKAPAALFRQPMLVADLPEFVSPAHPEATVALTAEGEAKLRALLLGRESMLDGWEKWGSIEF